MVHARNQHEKTLNRSSHVRPLLCVDNGSMVHDSNEHKQKRKENGSMVHDPNKHKRKQQQSSHVLTPYCFAGEWFRGS